ncbi:MAG: CvpA family protein [Desulfovibrionaceae bacterium]|nr:CvpA family protein [Desulfovibrionaceae bacterium]MDD4952261.1 CvpA family protein [Desulfovibrionaceae bacterium]
MNFLDIILLAAAGFFVYRGFRRGFVKEIVSLGSIALGVFVASRYHGLIAPHISVYLSNETGIKAASYLLAFVGTLVVCWIIAKILKNFLEVTVGESLDQAAGALFGLAEGVLVCLVILLALKSFLPNAAFVRGSKLAVKSEWMLGYLADFTPEAVRKTLEKSGINMPAGQPDTRPDQAPADKDKAGAL